LGWKVDKNARTGIEEDDGLEAGELVVVDLYFAQRLHNQVEDLARYLSDREIGLVARDYHAVAEYEHVRAADRATRRTEHEILARVRFEQSDLEFIYYICN
jgi:hypothetical protein